MEQTPALEDCLKLLRGERDEQRLAGLLLATKFCKGDDYASIGKVYGAVGVRFLDRLLRTGMGKGTVGVRKGDEREAYLQLSVTVLAAFCRVQEIASSKDMVSNIPLILEITSKCSGTSVVEECYEFLFLVSNASEDGLTTLYESEGMNVIACQMSTLPDGSHSLELAMRLVQLMLSKLPPDIIYTEFPSELSLVVAAIARQFAVLHNALKFEALHLLSGILSSKYAVRLQDALRSLSNQMWPTYIRVGVMAILQNRVASAEKLQALVLAEIMVSTLGESWLLGQVNLPDVHDSIPADRCLLLVLECSRVEVAVILNELAYLKYEASKNSSSTAESIILKQRDVAITFSLIEKIIKLISNVVCGGEGGLISESTLAKVITGLNETMGVVLEYLQDSKEHGQKKGDDLLAAVRVIGSYLAETPVACKEKVQELLGYILSVEGEDEPSPFYSICFFLPMLCQITMDVEGCKVLASSGGYRAVIECLVKLIMDGHTVEDNGSIFLACDIIMNFLLKRAEIQVQLDESITINLLKALAFWTEDIDDPSVIMMTSSICALIFDSTSEEALLNHSSFDRSILNSLSQQIVKSLATCGQELSDHMKGEADLHQIIIAGYSRWADRFPSIKKVIER